LHSPISALDVSVIEAAGTAALAESDDNDSSISSTGSLEMEGVKFPNPNGPTEATVTAALPRSLYEQGRTLAAEGCVPARKVRLHYTGGEDSLDFLARLHCVRAASAVLFSNEAFRAFVLQQTGRVLGAAIAAAGDDPAQGFNVGGTRQQILPRREKFHSFFVVFFLQTAWESMVAWVESLTAETAGQIRVELEPRGVVCLSVFDCIFDLILLDAFDDLEVKGKQGCFFMNS
jgi:hypothetical protein